jgi:hypothetical protein
MPNDYRENKKISDLIFWVASAVLVIVTIFVPERYAILVFLGAIWAMLFEISDRLRTHSDFHQRTAQSTEILVKRKIKDDEHI